MRPYGSAGGLYPPAVAHRQIQSKPKCPPVHSPRQVHIVPRPSPSLLILPQSCGLEPAGLYSLVCGYGCAHTLPSARVVATRFVDCAFWREEMLRAGSSLSDTAWFSYFSATLLAWRELAIDLQGAIALTPDLLWQFIKEEMVRLAILASFAGSAAAFAPLPLAGRPLQDVCSVSRYEVPLEVGQTKRQSAFSASAR